MEQVQNKIEMSEAVVTNKLRILKSDGTRSGFNSFCIVLSD